MRLSRSRLIPSRRDREAAIGGGDMCHLQNLDTPATPFVTKALQLHPLPKGLSIAGRRLERVRPTA
jgi:hypothetical protein